jgi:hypothetical protein
MFDKQTLDFLELKSPGTRSIYRAGLLSFQEFYQSQYLGGIPEFIDSLFADRDVKGWREQKHIASHVISKFVVWLEAEGFKHKTVRVYVSSIQQLAKYNGVPFATNDVKLPPSNPVLKKYSWTVDEVVKFFDLFDSPMYRSMGVLIFQSFIDSSTALSLRYQDIQKEYEAKITPLCLDVERPKTGIPFMSFIGKWGIKELHKYLDTRTDLDSSDAKLFDTTKGSLCDYFRKKAKLFLGDDFKDSDRNPCGSHSLRAGGSTLSRDSISGSGEHVHAVDRYLDFFMGKTVEEEKRVYSSKSKEGWRQTWKECCEPFVTPKHF